MTRLLALYVTSLALLLALSAPAPAVAGHSVPNPKIWWDVDDDGIVDLTDGDRWILRVGLQWNASKETSADLAADAWRDNSDFDPSFTTSTFSVATIRVDGQFPNSACGSGFSDGDVMVTCTRFDIEATFWDIFDSDIGVDLTPGVGGGLVWEWANVAPGPGEISFRGVATHEIGHVLLLNDLYGGTDCDATPTTMCGAANAGVDVGALTWELRTLASDDISSANSVY